ncbi:hypothetical protein G7075_06575 [Phycicoccus sp. HDW14]|uniref:site-2 protease family protein n=1 Tax=Phycicoccus sp. HDW14 TaxID=2714941 RepID=UPI00140D6D1B|nr:site-2 protease family protein [Phycicoccus sp. HDW14]QIM20875.1 hypothetical protein G7075_06575 [Phycicoccus sp. HDW14]
MSTSPPAPTGALRIGRVAGVPVYLDRTWLLLAALFAFTGFQAGQGRGTGVAVAFAVGNVVSIFVAVVGHEVGHALTARGLGFRVHQVVATVWGGHTSFDGTGATPGRSALVALSGPFVNVVLAVAGFAVDVAASGLTSDFAWYFGYLNAALAVFNLLPGLPLDGGAAVQSLVWAVTGRRDLGLLVAGWIGRAVAVVVLVLFAGLPLLRGTAPSCGPSPSAWSWRGSSGRAPPRRSGGPGSSGSSTPCTSATPCSGPWSCPPTHRWPSPAPTPTSSSASTSGSRPPSSCARCPRRRPRPPPSGPSSPGSRTPTSSRRRPRTASARSCAP